MENNKRTEKEGRQILMSRYQSGNMAGEIWVQWFSCCINQPAAQQRKRVQQRVRRIDRSMIGSPTNFQHTGHIGSGDVDTGNSRLRAIQNQMQSKGGYETAFSTVQAC
ncbi:CDC42 small effector protein homolog isoform X2 [Cryptotermes secundus]|uniref:CDC42 small effector protein homolog isoform X2 n=1 Tax=Cryptotermes secundus TaxID=105785 RepID=UPI000CD7AEDA|nr:CDC42 small effector protein homolog isoform X2 [Cryptotermes secundus]